MALKTRCIKCKTYIDMGETYCDKHRPNRKKDYKNLQKKLNIKEEEKGKLSARKWRDVRQQALIRDLYCCRLCLLNNYMENRNLEVHHMKKRVDREDLTYNLDNLITLCHNHHKMIENLPHEDQIKILKLEKGR